MNSPLELTKLKNIINVEFELPEVISIVYFSKKEIQLDSNLLALIQSSLNNNQVYAEMWIVNTQKQLYVLVGLNLDFFSMKQANDPFRESDDFYVFATQIKKQLGITHAETFISEDGYYYSCITENSQKYSIFAYKL